VIYLGEFAVDEDQPYFRMEAPESETGLPRQVIVFCLLPVGSVIRDPQDELELPYEIRAPELDAIISGQEEQAVVVRVPVERQNVEEVEVSRTTDSYTAIRPSKRSSSPTQVSWRERDWPSVGSGFGPQVKLARSSAGDGWARFDKPAP
jgi:hypothetical protein